MGMSISCRMEQEEKILRSRISIVRLAGAL